MKKTLWFLLALCLMLPAAALALEEIPADEYREYILKTGIELGEPYEETVVITTVEVNKGEAKTYGKDTWADNMYTRAAKELLNIQVETLWDSGDYDTKLNLAIASGSIPDAFICNLATFEELSAAGMLQDLQEAYDVYLCDSMKGRYAADKIAYESGIRDGELLGLSRLSYGNLESIRYLWIRDSWLRETGMEGPQTWDELLAVGRKMVEQHPGAYALATGRDLQELMRLAPCFGAYPETWLRDGEGNLVYGGVQPEMKDALTAFAQMYEEGLLATTFTAMDTAKMQEEVINGKAGMLPWYSWFGAVPGKDLASISGEDGLFTAYALPSATGEAVVHPLAWGTDSYLVVSKACEHPEAVIKLMNLKCAIESLSIVNEEANNYYSGDNRTHLFETFLTFNPVASLMSVRLIRAYLETGVEQEGMLPAWIKKQNRIENFIRDGLACDNAMTSMANYVQFKAQCIGSDILSAGNVISTEFKGIQPEIMVEMGSVLSDILIEGYTKIIVGQESPDYFDTLVKNWAAAGGEELTEEMNALYR